MSRSKRASHGASSLEWVFRRLESLRRACSACKNQPFGPVRCLSRGSLWEQRPGVLLGSTPGCVILSKSLQASGLPSFFCKRRELKHRVLKFLQNNTLYIQILIYVCVLLYVHYIYTFCICAIYIQPLSVHTHTHTHTHTYIYTLYMGFPHGAVVKNLPANAGDERDAGLIPGLGRFPRGGNGNQL